MGVCSICHRRVEGLTLVKQDVLFLPECTFLQIKRRSRAAAGTPTERLFRPGTTRMAVLRQTVRPRIIITLTEATSSWSLVLHPIIFTLSNSSLSPSFLKLNPNRYITILGPIIFKDSSLIIPQLCSSPSPGFSGWLVVARLCNLPTLLAITPFRYSILKNLPNGKTRQHRSLFLSPIPIKLGRPWPTAIYHCPLGMSVIR